MRKEGVSCVHSESSVVVVAALAVDCESVLEPEVAPLPPQLTHVPNNPQNRGSVSSSVVGGGQVFVNGVLRHFSFTALDQRTGPANATVVGQFEIFDPTTDERVHGIVTCFGFFSPGARVGGQVTQPPPGIGGVVEVGFRVVDNGPPGPNPDQISDLITHVNNAAQGVFCNGGGPDPALTGITAGNIQVRDHPTTP